jgi:hypothetical protein
MRTGVRYRQHPGVTDVQSLLHHLRRRTSYSALLRDERPCPLPPTATT